MSKGLEALYKIANAEMKEQYKVTKNDFVYRVISDEYSKELKIIEKELKEGEVNKNASEILRIIFNAPFIIQTLFEKGEFGKNAKERYLWGTISDEEVQKVKEFFSDGE